MTVHSAQLSAMLANSQEHVDVLAENRGQLEMYAKDLNATIDDLKEKHSIFFNESTAVHQREIYELRMNHEQVLVAMTETLDEAERESAGDKGLVEFLREVQKALLRDLAAVREQVRANPNMQQELVLPSELAMLKFRLKNEEEKFARLKKHLEQSFPKEESATGTDSNAIGGAEKSNTAGVQTAETGHDALDATVSIPFYSSVLRPTFVWLFPSKGVWIASSLPLPLLASLSRDYFPLPNVC